MAFYLCFALVLGLPRRGAVAALAVGFAGLVTANLITSLPPGLSYLGASQILEFVAGLLIAEMALSGWRLPRWVAGALVLGGLAATVTLVGSMDSWWGTWRGIAWGSPAAAIVGGMALCPPVGASGVIRRWFERLGNASYALYLVHYGLYVAIEALLGRVMDLTRLPPIPFMLLLIGSAVVAGFSVHRVFEVPVTRWLQRRVAPGQTLSMAVAEGKTSG